jgi:hypothetical protein
VSKQLYRHVGDDNVNFDYDMRHATSPGAEMPHGTMIERDPRGLPIGFFVPVAPFWGMMYDRDTLYRRGSFGGTSDQFVGNVLKNRLFTPVKQADLIIVEEFTNGVFESDQMSGFTKLDPGRYAVVRQRDGRVAATGPT